MKQIYEIGCMFQNHVGGNLFIRQVIKEAANEQIAKKELVNELEQYGGIKKKQWNSYNSLKRMALSISYRFQMVLIRYLYGDKSMYQIAHTHLFRFHHGREIL